MTKQENDKWVEFEAQSGSGYERIHVTYYKQEQRFFVSGTHDGHMGMPCVEFTLTDLGITPQATPQATPQVTKLKELYRQNSE